MTDPTRSDRVLADWESPNRLLARYLRSGGLQALGALLCLAGFVVLAVGWWKISKESIVALQLPYLVSGGIGGILLLGLGGILLVSHDLRLDNRRLEAIEEAIAELRDALLIELDSDGASSTAASTAPAPRRAHSNGSYTSDSPSFVRVAGGTRYHLPDCAVASGKPVDPVSADEVDELQPCKLCAPNLALS